MDSVWATRDANFRQKNKSIFFPRNAKINLGIHFAYLNKDKNYFSKSRRSFKNSPSQESREEWENLELAGMPENGRES